VPLGTEYSVPNGTEMVGYLISTNIMSLAEQVLFKCVDPVEIQPFFKKIKFLVYFKNVPTCRSEGTQAGRGREGNLYKERDVIDY
jgi:hypothetical protein